VSPFSAVEDPAGQPLGVLAQESAFAGRDLHLVEVVPRLVAVVQSHVEGVGIGPGHGVDEGADAFRVGQVARGRHLLAGGGRRRRIDGVDVEVLVASLVLHEEDELAVLTPEIPGDGALGVRGERVGLLEGLVRPLDPDVAGAVERLDEREVLAVGRELAADDLGVAEEELAVDQRRLPGLGPARGREGHQAGDGPREEPAGAGPAGGSGVHTRNLQCMVKESFGERTAC
jgi:hypothetical protein